MVKVNVSKLDRAWARDEGFYIPRGGGGAEIGGRRAGFERFLKSNRSVQASTVSVDKRGVVSFVDGRHRFSVLRDRGKRSVYVAVPRGQERRIKSLFGAS